MKKLLALVLCVMMFVSVLPTAAFAGSYLPNVDSNTVASYNKQIKNMIKNTKSDIEKAYKALAGDKIVYTSAKAMDDTVVEMVNGIADPLIEKGKFTKDEADFVKNGIRWYLDEVVAEKIEKNMYKALDKDGNVDNLKYANLVAESISKALTDKKFIAGYEAVATFFALKSVIKDINDNLSDEWDAFVDGIDTKFQAKFAAQYTTLVSDYIDTLDTAAEKLFIAANADDIYADALADAQAEYDAVVVPAKATRDTATAAATTKYDTTVADAEAKRDDAVQKAADARDAVVDPAAETRDNDIKAANDAFDAVEKPAQIARTLGEEWSQAQYEKDMDAAETKRDGNLAWVENQYEIDMAAAGDDKQLQAQAKYDHDMRVLGIENTFATEKATADSDLATRMQLQADTYNAVVDPAKITRDNAVDAAEAAYETATADAIAAYEAAEKAANEECTTTVEGAFLDFVDATADAQAIYDAIEEAAETAKTLADQEAFIDWVENSNPDINPWAIYLEVGNPDWT